MSTPDEYYGFPEQERAQQEFAGTDAERNRAIIEQLGVLQKQGRIDEHLVRDIISGLDAPSGQVFGNDQVKVTLGLDGHYRVLVREGGGEWTVFENNGHESPAVDQAA